MGKKPPCEEEGCCKQAIGSTGYCTGHGGGKRCQQEGCLKAAHSGGTPHCIAHGGGRRCQQEGCTKAAASGGTTHCMAHGGGKRCREEDCFELVARASQYCRRCPQRALPNSRTPAHHVPGG